MKVKYELAITVNIQNPKLISKVTSKYNRVGLLFLIVDSRHWVRIFADLITETFYEESGFSLRCT